MSYYLFLDDERMPGNVTWITMPGDRAYQIVRNYDQFVQHITTNGVPDFVTFDHDLADEHYAAMLRDCQLNSTGQLLFAVAETLVDVDYGVERTGYDCAKWLVDYCADNGYKFPPYTVHSMNPIGSKRITDYITNAKQHLDI